jgi:hypothetical protein
MDLDSADKVSRYACSQNKGFKRQRSPLGMFNEMSIADLSDIVKKNSPKYSSVMGEDDFIEC